MPRLFALDQNFPEPIVQALDRYIAEAELVPLRQIDARLTADIDDWEVILALHHHERPWDGLITSDEGMLSLHRELSVVRQTNFTLVVAHDSGHDPIKATGLLLTHLPWICRETSPDEGQVWRLVARNRPGEDPWDYLEKIGLHQHRPAEDLWQEGRLTRAELQQDPLADR